MSDKFQLLLQQIGMPLDARQSGAFSTATIEKVVLHKVSKLWEFTFRFETPLPLMDYQLFKARLATEFEKVGNKIQFSIVSDAEAFEAGLVEAYYPEAFTEDLCQSAGFKALFQPLEVTYRDGVLWIKGPETIDTDHFRKNHLPNLVEQYKRFGFGNLAVDIQVCQEMTRQQAEIFHAQNEEIYQQANEENLAV